VVYFISHKHWTDALYLLSQFEKEFGQEEYEQIVEQAFGDKNKVQFLKNVMAIFKEAKLSKGELVALFEHVNRLADKSPEQLSNYLRISRLISESPSQEIQ